MNLIQHLEASRSEVFRVFIDPRFVAVWMIPPDMSCRIHSFDPRPGGSFDITLRYDDMTGSSDTPSYTVTYNGRFVDLVPDERIVQFLKIERSEPVYEGEMTVTFLLRDKGRGTDILVESNGQPPPLTPSEILPGWQASLARLAVVAEFQQRYRRQKIATVPFVVVLIVGAFSGLAYRLDLLKGPFPIMGWSLVGALVVLGLFGAWNWRCPACGLNLGKKLSPVLCRHCGVVLRP